MSDLGPGDWVQALASYTAVDGQFQEHTISITEGTVYQVASLFISAWWKCGLCYAPDAIALQLVGQPTNAGGWCPCTFRKWPPPAETNLVLDEVWEELKDDQLVRA